ncbi:MAG: beta-lactamase family protein [Proteobacteria bacterium]|nr:beta-lactamase family protein [Pseudomonadota bacterium]
MAPWSSPEAAGFDGRALDLLDRDLARMHDDGALPAIALLIARHGREVRVTCHGGSGAASTPAVDAETPFRWYSLSKPVTSFALLTLHDEGRWQPGDPLARHLPELADLRVAVADDRAAISALATEPLQRPPTVQDLLGHRAGFAYGIATPPPHPVDALYARRRVLDFQQPLARLVGRAAALPLVAQPGQRFHYSIAHDLQGAVVERLCGQPFGDALRQRVLAPLGMHDTGFHVTPAQAPRLAALWQSGAGGRAEAAAPGPLVWDVTQPPALQSGGGGLVGSLADLHRFAQAVMAVATNAPGALLGPRSRALAVTPLHHQVPAAGGHPTALGYCGGGLYRLDEPAVLGSPVNPGTLQAAGAGGGFFSADPASGIVLCGLMSVLGWRRPEVPAFLAEQRVYAALRADVDRAFLST